MPGTEDSLHTRWDGYGTIAVVIDDFLERLRNDPLVWRVWTVQHAAFLARRVRQLTVEYIAAAIGGPTYGSSRDVETAPVGMGFTRYEYAAFTRNLEATLEKFAVPEPERNVIRTLITSLKLQIIEK